MVRNDRQNESSRRSFAAALTRGPIIAGLSSISGSWITSAQDAQGSQFKGVPHLSGTLSLDLATRRTYAEDYGQIIHELPAAVLRTESVADIEKMIAFARWFHIRIVARGQGHQPFGQAQVSGGLVIDMRPLRRVHSISSDRIDVDAGADWRTILQAALQRGLTPPVLPAYLGLTVGGTLSTGGVGPTTFRNGAQVDNVFELEAFTGSGQLLKCSETENRDVFESALAGQGQTAVIKRAILRLVPAPASIREYLLTYRDLEALLQDQTLLMKDDRFSGLVALLTPTNGQWSYTLSATRGLNPTDSISDSAMLNGLAYIAGSERIRNAPYAEYADAIPNFEFGKPRPDLGLVAPASRVASFLANMLPRLTPDDLGTVSGIRLFLWKRAVFTRPLFRLPAEDNVAYLAILRTEAEDSGIAARMLAGNRILFERCREDGGTLYPFSALRMSRNDWRRHYGEAWSALRKTKARYDPDDVFASGPDVLCPGSHCSN